MRIIKTMVVLLLLASQCTGCLQYATWQQDYRNYRQKKHYVNALKKRAMSLQPMISLYDVHMVSQSKVWGITAGTARWMALYEDGILFMLMEDWDNLRWQHDVNFISGQWKKGEETEVILLRQEGTNFINYATADLASASKFQVRLWSSKKQEPLLNPSKTNRIEHMRQ